MEQPIPFVDLPTQNQTIEAEIEAAIRGVLQRSDFILGKSVDDFEAAFAQFSGTEHCVGVSSGLDALRLSLQALDIGAGDEVILPANTFIATALAVSAVGARPVLVDCDLQSYNMDPAFIERAITARTMPELEHNVSVSVDGQVYRDSLFVPIDENAEVFILPKLQGG